MIKTFATKYSILFIAALTGQVFCFIIILIRICIELRFDMGRPADLVLKFRTNVRRESCPKRILYMLFAWEITHRFFQLFDPF